MPTGYLTFNNDRNVCSPDPAWNGTFIGYPYIEFKLALRFYASLFGVRAILWHQGEADNHLQTSTNDYEADLQYVIQKARSHLANQGLSWIVAKATYNVNVPAAQSDYLRDGVRQAQDNVGGSLPNSGGRGPDTDQIINRSDGVHFDGDKLRQAGELWADQVRDEINAQRVQTPISASEPLNVSMSLNGSLYTITAEAGLQNYYWYDPIYAERPGLNQPTDQSVTAFGGLIRCYAKTYQGAGLFRVSPLVYITLGGGRLATVQSNEEALGFSLRVVPNPVEDRVTIRVTLPRPAQVMLTVFDATGKLVKTIARNYHDSGEFNYPVDISSLTAGTYLCRLQADDLFLTTKLLKIK